MHVNSVYKCFLFLVFSCVFCSTTLSQKLPAILQFSDTTNQMYLPDFSYAVHPLSFNTFSTKNVYKNCEVFKKPILDQHSGANHQNLFDNITVYVEPKDDNSYSLFEGGGAGYWKPSHGAFSTFWNISVHFLDGFENKGPVLLNGMEDGPFARLVGINANREIKVVYGPKAHIEKVNGILDDIPSLYEYQLKNRLGR